MASLLIFATISDAQLDKLVENKDAKNTKRPTLLARSVFEGQLARKGRRGTKNQGRNLQCIKIVL